jgi:creatinine amidohydrolase
MRPWILSEVNYDYVKKNPYEVAVLPMGATEPHNLHLPYGTDMIEGTVIGERACEVAHKAGGKVVLLPTMPYGTETNMKEFPLAMNLYPTTIFQIVSDLVESLVRSGIRKVVLINSHGGNDLKPLLRELYGRTPAAIFLCNWYLMTGDIQKEILKHPDDHAGEMETSFLLRVAPQLVGKTPDGKLNADDGAVAKSRFDAVNRGWVSITRPWHLLTTNSGSGYPHEATAEKGERIIAATAERLGAFLAELSASKLDEKFPF